MEVKREACIYTKCYCEENVWKLCKHFADTDCDTLQKCYVVFISNHSKTVPIWKQSAAELDEPVVWDYHVIFVYCAGSADCKIYDLDTVLSFPESFDSYIQQAFRSDLALKKSFQQYFRLIPGNLYLEKFASDRRHMAKADGSWLSPPPDYPPIRTATSTHNIDDFISMDPGVGWGEILSLDQFSKRFCNRDATG